MPRITYAIHPDGYVVSRQDRQLYWPILEYEKMCPENHFQTSYRWEKISVHSVGSEWSSLHWTKKIPIELKNFHRALWGMKPLKEKPCDSESSTSLTACAESP